MNEPTTTAKAADPFAGLEAQAGAIDASAPDSGQPGAPPPPEVSTAEVLEQVIAPAFDIFAPDWRVSRAESAQLAQVYAGLIDKYFPGGVGQIGPELGAAVVTLAIIGPRWNLPRKHAAERDANKNSDLQDKNNQAKTAAPADLDDGVPNPALQ